jgi:hypothetical protein
MYVMRCDAMGCEWNSDTVMSLTLAEGDVVAT